MYYIINKYNCVIDEKKYFQKNIFFYVKKNIFRKKIFSKKKKIQEKNFGWKKKIREKKNLDEKKY